MTSICVVVYLDPLLLFNFAFVRLRLKALPSILLVFSDAFYVISVVIAPVVNQL